MAPFARWRAAAARTTRFECRFLGALGSELLPLAEAPGGSAAERRERLGARLQAHPAQAEREDQLEAEVGSELERLDVFLNASTRRAAAASRPRRAAGPAA